MLQGEDGDTRRVHCKWGLVQKCLKRLWRLGAFQFLTLRNRRACGLENQTVLVRCPTNVLLLSMHTGSGNHTAFDSMGSCTHSLGITRPECETNHSHPLVPGLIMHGLILSLRHSCPGHQLIGGVNTSLDYLEIWCRQTQVSRCEKN